MDTEQMAAEIAARAIRRGVTIGVSESLTGGNLSAALAAAPRAAEWFRGGIVAYSRTSKHQLLRVPPGPVVSAAAAAAMAARTAELLDADVAVAVTGAGGPDPQDGEPPGTVWIALHPGSAEREQFAGRPAEVVAATVQGALELLNGRLSVRV